MIAPSRGITVCALSLTTLNVLSFSLAAHVLPSRIFWAAINTKTIKKLLSLLVIPIGN